jgi:hypothetical protein
MKGGMIVDIYVSSIANQTHEQTPFHVYQGTSDFATILNDMRKGELPVGTGKPFPVNFQEEDNPINPMSPWSQNYTTNTYEPPRSDIIGPHAFGL